MRILTSPYQTAYRAKPYTVGSSTSVMVASNKIAVDRLEIHFQGNLQQSRRSSGLWRRLTHGPTPKLIFGSLLVGLGVTTKLLGLGTVVGAPILLPLGLGIAGVGTLIMGWGLIQYLNRPSNKVEKMPDSPHGVNLTNFNDISSDTNNTTPLNVDQTQKDSDDSIKDECSTPLKDIVPYIPSEITPRELPTKEKHKPILDEFVKPDTSELDETLLDDSEAPELPPTIQPFVHRRLYPPIQRPKKDEHKKFDSLKPEPFSPKAVSPDYKNGSRVLSTVLQNEPLITQDAYGEFFATAKGSDQAVAAGEKLHLFLRHDSSPNEFCRNGKTPLTNAFLKHRPWLIQQLSNTPGIKPDRKCLTGPSALKTALLTDQANLIRPALRKADPVDIEMLEWAALCGHSDVLKRLIERSPNLLKPSEQKALFSLTERQRDKIQQLKAINNKDMIQNQLWGNIWISPTASQSEQNQNLENNVALLRAGANPHKMRDGHYPHNVACAYGNNQMLQPLLASGVDCFKKDLETYQKEENVPNLYYSEAKQALPLACEKGHNELVKTLLKAGISQDYQKYPPYSSPIFLAALGARSDIVKTLLDDGLDPNAPVGQNRHNITPLMISATWAREQQSINVMKLLIEAGADVNAQEDRYGRTALHQAVEEERTPAVSFLVQIPEIRINQMDKKGRTPLDYAKSRGHDQIAQILREHGAQD